MTSDRPAPTPFQAQRELLQVFLTHRDRIADRIQGLLNGQDKPPHALQDRAQLSRQFEESFFAAPVVAREQLALRGSVQHAHWAEGFKPRDMPGIPNEMFDPADLMVRAFTLWRSTRWPGRNGRVHFAQTLFNLYVVRSLALLALRVWDEDQAGAGDRLAELQRLLDALWKGSPAGQPVLVRDVRWLVPVAQSPTTDELAPYFRVAAKVSTLPDADRLEILKASVMMAGGHLRSQLRHFLMQGKSLDDHALLLSTRRSNALDCAMTIQALVPLLAEYERSLQGDDRARRQALAGVICQGISPDPVLYVNRLDLLRAYSTIEHLFASSDPAGQASLTAMGERHLGLVTQYQALMPRVAAALARDCEAFRPRPLHYSPHGVMYGFSSNLLEHMTMKATQPGSETRFSLEDVFADAGEGAARLDWVSGWRRLPHMPLEVQQLYAYPQQFAEDIFARIEQALDARRVAAAEEAATPRAGRLHVSPARGSASVPPLAPRFLFSTDPALVQAGRAEPIDAARLHADRNEGEYLVSYATPGGWLAISKDVLTDVLGAGTDARLDDVPASAISALSLLYPDLVVVD